ncbi:NAD/NADP transhydrogenase alpha subunit [Cystobacter fuscus DSM 2262]|uniref:NAD/NADP transhydrogenase alpha subunit n=1 Tax=Cystobacter fuscus (strain ATCC 25194 / DSM 2262 / NBRC 100088 / M29) TaxID=1242864 RepID=S9PMM4_CYSF2|nr:MSMEG_0570 family nitrogen starvation response protein [Cystobacter fuscus]EPX64291.1 NAD/NADP transhydrogenase alpha subunit [Cystobacter fuscus DSM 2262]
MPAVNIKLRWPDGKLSTAYSPSTVVYEHFKAGHSYPLADFLSLAETAFNAASERVKQVRGFYCSSAMDSLAGLRLLARQYPARGARVEVLDLRTHGAEQV